MKKKCGTRRPVPQHNIRWAWKQRNKNWRCIFVAAKRSEVRITDATTHRDCRHTAIHLWFRYLPEYYHLSDVFGRQTSPVSETERHVSSVVKVTEL